MAAPPAKLPGYAGASPNPAHFPDQTPDVLKLGKSVFDPVGGRWERGRSKTCEVAGRARAQWGVSKKADEQPKNETHLSKWANPTANGAPAASRDEVSTPTPSSSSASDATIRPSQPQTQPNGALPRPTPQLATPVPPAAATAAGKSNLSLASAAPPTTSRHAPPRSAAAPPASAAQPTEPSEAKGPVKAEAKDEVRKELEKVSPRSVLLALAGVQDARILCCRGAYVETLTHTNMTASSGTGN